MTTQTQEGKAGACLRAHGFWMDEGPRGRLYVMRPAGVDPTDGAPLTWADEATPAEAALWSMGRLPELARLLHARGVPVTILAPEPVTWWAWLKGLLGMGG